MVRDAKIKPISIYHNSLNIFYSSRPSNATVNGSSGEELSVAELLSEFRGLASDLKTQDPALLGQKGRKVQKPGNPYTTFQGLPSSQRSRRNRLTERPPHFPSIKSAHQYIIFRRPMSHSAELYTPRTEPSEWASCSSIQSLLN